ncbi:MarR family winged helix-turn-helix transcriptional regulator [Synoicihabitans lomoniglobus]|uniref:MarR family transcriptional regulator n=1 Tax=Synoicihabitans lomoniglobus TaxID=2909285 RepID=A0AAF0CRG6_9BACT|nr:MarR family transcriptional regulator [Opitutaceae bacterium LMO-M01]WED66679.1 MarR family transcriptional regulator [Opitutaceae bacterium LMO-M01]
MLKDLPHYECLLECAKHFPDLDPAASGLFMNMLRTADELFAIKSDFLQRHNTSNGRFTVLMLLSAAGPAEGECAPPRSPAALAEMAGVTRATMTGLIDTLERDGFVRREADPHDRRAMLVHLTTQGEAFTRELLPGYFRQVTAIMAPLQRSEQEELMRLLMKVRRGIATASQVEAAETSSV